MLTLGCTLNMMSELRGAGLAGFHALVGAPGGHHVHGWIQGGEDGVCCRFEQASSVFAGFRNIINCLLHFRVDC